MISIVENSDCIEAMREILFRGLRTYGKGWVYGDLLTKDVHHGYVIVVNGCITHKVIRESIGQFTGLTDKNGTKIFEGDIISYYGSESGQEITYSHDGRLVWRNQNGNFTISAIEIHDPLQLEIIGNIHEKGGDLCMG